MTHQPAQFLRNSGSTNPKSPTVSHTKRTSALTYFTDAVPYFRITRKGGALPYLTGAQLYFGSAEPVEYSFCCTFTNAGNKIR